MDNKQRHPAPKTAGLPNILNTDDRAPTYNGHPHYRDSGFYSNGDTSSKRALLPSQLNWVILIFMA